MKTNITNLAARTPLRTTMGLGGSRRTLFTYATAPQLRGMRILRGTMRAKSNVGIGQPIPQQPPPVVLTPTLTSLNPDASGNWNAEVVLTGTNFTKDSVALANGQVVT